MPETLWLVLLVVLPSVFLPGFLAGRAGIHTRAALSVGCLGLAGLFFMGGAQSPYLFGRVALMALFTGQLFALGKHCRASVPYNWMAYFAFVMANFTFPDTKILAAANFTSGAYLLCSGSLLLNRKWKGEEESEGNTNLPESA